MERNLKYTLYFLVCVAIFFALVKVFGGSFSSNQATAFEWEKTVNVYFAYNGPKEESDCTYVVPFPRTILNAETLGPGALGALLEGPILNELEMNRGLSSAIPENVLIQKFEIKDKVAFVDFNSSLNEGVAGSCRVLAIRSQIENTLNSLPDIDSVVISVNGQTEGILEP